MSFHGLVIHRLLDSLFGMVWMSAFFEFYEFFELFDFFHSVKGFQWFGDICMVCRSCGGRCGKSCGVTRLSVNLTGWPVLVEAILNFLNSLNSFNFLEGFCI